MAAVGIVGVVACGGSARSSDGEAPREPTPAAEPRTPPGAPRGTPLEQRRDAACDQLGPKLTACAVEDARATLAAGKTTKAEFDRDTAPAIQRKNTDDFVQRCKTTVFSSRQVRVLEVCFREETTCAPLLDCLDHLRGDRDARPPR
jgi:hypothetical protein